MLNKTKQTSCFEHINTNKKKNYKIYNIPICHPVVKNYITNTDTTSIHTTFKQDHLKEFIPMNKL